MLKEFSCILLDIIYPQACKNCGKSLYSYKERVVCRECLETIEFIKQENICYRCGKKFQIDHKIENKRLLICRDCKNRKIYFDRARHIAEYTGVVKILINEMKYKKKTLLKSLLAGMINEYIFTTKNQKYRVYDYITFVPMAKSGYAERGFNQAELIAEELCRLGGFRKGILLRKKWITRQQAGLSKKERLENIKDCFIVDNPEEVEGKGILIIDDVFTTGTTVNECARVLKKAGTRTVDIITIARGKS